jgi:hypothetical protein
MTGEVVVEVSVGDAVVMVVEEEAVVGGKVRVDCGVRTWATVGSSSSRCSDVDWLTRWLGVFNCAETALLAVKFGAGGVKRPVFGDFPSFGMRVWGPGDFNFGFLRSLDWALFLSLLFRTVVRVLRVRLRVSRVLLLRIVGMLWYVCGMSVSVYVLWSKVR